MDDIANAVAGIAGLVENFLDRLAIRKTYRGAGAVGGELAHQIPSHRSLFVTQKELLEFANILESAAIGEGAAGIHRESVMEREWLTGKADTGLRFTFSANAR